MAVYKKSSRAHYLVADAVAKGNLPSLRKGRVECVDCGKRAIQYDHRDYAKPLEVEPVCRSCNRKRGFGKNRGKLLHDGDYEMTPTRAYLYKIRVIRYLASLPAATATRANLTRKMLTNISKAHRNALLDDMLAQQYITVGIELPDITGSKRPRTIYTITKKGRQLYTRHRAKCEAGEMRKLIPGIRA